MALRVFLYRGIDKKGKLTYMLEIHDLITIFWTSW